MISEKVKRLPFFLLLFLPFCVSAQVNGNGNVISLERIATNFNKIRVEDGLQVYLSQGNDEIVEIKTDRNLQEFIRAESKKGVLRIYSTQRIGRATSLKIYVTCKKMVRVECYNAGKLTTESPIRTDDLAIKASGRSKINMQVKCEDIEIKQSDEAEITLSGKTEELEAKVSDNSKLQALDLQSEECELTVTGNSNAYVSVSENLQVKTKSRSKVVYRGNPNKISIKNSKDSSVSNE